MRPSNALKALALAALLCVASTAALAGNDPSSDGSRQRQRQSQEQHQSAIPGIIDEIPGLGSSDSSASDSQSTDGTSQSQEQTQDQSQCMICVP
jgi:hypothetical protein